MSILHYACACLIFLGLASSLASGGGRSPQVKQSPEVVEAYDICRRFERVLGETLDFDRAYEAAFVTDPARRRAIVTAGRESGGLDYRSIDDATLIDVYKKHMQIFYLVLILGGPSEAEARLYFPPDIKQILERKPPKDNREFAAYVAQLDRDAAYFRAHLERLAARYPEAAERIRQFKSEALSSKFEPPTDRQVEPEHGYYKGKVSTKDEPFYQINGYTVIKDNGRMRIVGIRFFNRLF